MYGVRSHSKDSPAKLSGMTYVSETKTREWNGGRLSSTCFKGQPAYVETPLECMVNTECPCTPSVTHMEELGAQCEVVFA
jgi:hypothetical protein